MTLASRVSFPVSHMNGLLRRKQHISLAIRSQKNILKLSNSVFRLHKAGSGHSRQCWCILLLDKWNFGISSCSSFSLVARRLSMQRIWWPQLHWQVSMPNRSELYPNHDPIKCFLGHRHSLNDFLHSAEKTLFGKTKNRYLEPPHAVPAWYV